MLKPVSLAVLFLASCGSSPGESPVGAVLTMDDVFSIATPTSTQLSPDGRLIAYTLVRLVDGNWREGLHVIGADGSGDREITASGDTPRWAPDGSRIAWIDRAAQPGQVFSAEPDGSGPDQITSLEGGVTDFAWAPDGRSVAVTSLLGKVGSARTQIVLVPLGGTPRQLTTS